MLGSRARNLLRLPAHTRLSFRPATFQTSSPPFFCLVAVRNYATPGRPRKAVGEPSTPVKRTSKATGRTRARAAPRTTQAKAKPKPKAKSKAKTTSKKRVRKAEQTPEQQEKAKLKVERAKLKRQSQREKLKIAELKKKALTPPLALHYSAMHMFVQERVAKSKVESPNLKGPEHFAKVISQDWKAVSAADREHYNHLAHTQTNASLAEYKRWVESHTPEEIAIANNARTQLRRKVPGARARKYTLIKDERQVKRPRVPYMQFNVNRQASGDFDHIAVPERAKLIAKEWKALDANEKHKYEELFRKDSKRYHEELNDVYGRPSPQSKRHAVTSTRTAAAA